MAVPPSGRAASPFEISEYLTREQLWVLQQQIVQQSEHSVVLRLVPPRQPNPNELEAVESKEIKLDSNRIGEPFIRSLPYLTGRG